MKILKEYPYVPYSNELTDRLTDTRRTSRPWNFVAFTTKVIPEIGPSVRFYGGTVTTGITPCAPSLAFDIYGNCEVILSEWMTEENCPNAFDLAFVGRITKFVQENLPVLCLLYLGKLSAADAMDYFTGKDKWEIMLSGIRNLPDADYLRLQYATDPYDLHKTLFEMGIYKTICGEISADEFEKSVCLRLRAVLQTVFEEDWIADEWMITEYRGRAKNVYIPEDIVLIGEEVFAGHGEIEYVYFPKGCCGICDRAFAGCANLQKLFLPEACDLIGQEAFAECTGLRVLLLPPKGVIESGAFRHCIGLGEIDIPEGITFIGEDAFAGCDNLVIRCKENSCAHEYAQKNGIPCDIQS